MWTAQVNDVIGGWIVTKFPKPLSEHFPDGRNGVIIAECISEEDAQWVADALNSYDRT